MKKVALIDAELQQINFLDDRFYYAGQDENGNDRFYPSVTTVLSLYPKGPQFQQWLKDVGANADLIGERAMEAGSKVHNGIEMILSGQDLYWGSEGENYSLEEWQGLNRFMEFYEKSGLEVIVNEAKCYSHKYRYAGTMDLLCRIGDKIWLIDYKFGNAIYPTYYQQIMAYKVAIEEVNPNLKIDHVGVLHLKGKTRTEKIDPEKNVYQGLGWQLVDPMNDSSVKKLAAKHEAEPYEIVWENFERILGIYYHENPDPKPKNLSYPMKLSLNIERPEGEEPQKAPEVRDQTLMDIFEEDRQKWLNLS
jgi:hypothetical protein